MVSINPTYAKGRASSAAMPANREFSAPSRGQETLRERRPTREEANLARFEKDLEKNLARILVVAEDIVKIAREAESVMEVIREPGDNKEGMAALWESIEEAKDKLFIELVTLRVAQNNLISQMAEEGSGEFNELKRKYAVEDILDGRI